MSPLRGGRDSIAITRRDATMLLAPNWLNDNVVDVYLRLASSLSSSQSSLLESSVIFPNIPNEQYSLFPIDC